MGDQVIGHYVPGQDGQGWKAVQANSTDLFKALVQDDLQAFEKLFASSEPGVPSCSSSSWHTVLFWTSAADSKDGEARARTEAKSRTLAMLATQHGSVRVLSFLLSKGSCPTEQAKDGADCYTVSVVCGCGLGVGRWVGQSLPIGVRGDAQGPSATIRQPQ